MNIFEVADQHAMRTSSAVGTTTAALMLAAKTLERESLPALWYIFVCILVGYVAYRLSKAVAYLVYMTWIGAFPLPPIYNNLFDTADGQDVAASPVAEESTQSRSGGPVRDPNYKKQEPVGTVRNELVGYAPTTTHSAVFEDYPEILPKLIAFLRENPKRIFSGRGLEVAGVVKRDPRFLPNARIVLEYLEGEGLMDNKGNQMFSLNERGREWLRDMIGGE